MNVFLLMLLAFCNVEDGLEKRYGNLGEVSVRLKCSEPTNIYLTEDFPALYRGPTVVAMLSHNGKAPVALAGQAGLVDFYGNKRSVRPGTVDITLQPGESRRLSFTTDPARGAFTFRLALQDGSQADGVPQLFKRPFLVLPSPASQRQFSEPPAMPFFAIEGAPVWRPFTGEICRRIGIQTAAVFVDQDISRELFDGWGSAVRRRGLNLLPMFPSTALTGGGANRTNDFATRSNGSAGSGMTGISAQPRWPRAKLRLTPKELDPGLFQWAGRQILQSYALEGRFCQLACLLQRAPEQGLETLSSLGFLMNTSSGAYPAADHSLYQRLNEASRLARHHGLLPLLCRYVPAGTGRAQASHLVASYTLASLAGFASVGLHGPNGILSRNGEDNLALCGVHNTLAHFMNNRVAVADVWPNHTLLFGCVFAAPHERPAGGQRADVLSIRDRHLKSSLQDAEQDALKVAVVFSAASAEAGGQRELFIPNSEDMAAQNLMGGATGMRRKQGLLIPFGSEPVYITTRRLSVNDLLGKLRDSHIRGLDLFHMFLQPFCKQALDMPALRLTMNNNDTQALHGTWKMDSRGWQTEPATGLRFTLKPGEFSSWVLPMKKSVRNDSCTYPFTMNLDMGNRKQRFQVLVPTAMMWRVSPRIDGGLDEWRSKPSLKITPFEHSPYRFRPAAQLTGEANQAPSGLAAVAGNAYAGPGGALWTGHDTSHVYLAVKVREKEMHAPWDGSLAASDIGRALTGSAVQVAFGLVDRTEPTVDRDAKGEGRTLPASGKVHGDYLFLLAPVKNGRAALVCLHKTDMTWGESLLRGAMAVPGAKVAVKRQGAETQYEAAIPRSFLEGLMQSDRRVKIGCVLHTRDGACQLGDSFGVSRHFSSGDTFLPALDEHFLPNLIVWGVEQ